MRTQPVLAGAISDAREHTDELFRLIRPDSLYERTIPERHRLVFYLGHLEAFDWNLIARYALDRPSFHPSFDQLFAFGIDPPPGQLPNDQPSDWPTLAEVERYNQRTRDEIDDMLPDVPEQLLHVALEHRLMHAETFAYLMHALSYDRKIPRSSDPITAGPRVRRKFVTIPAGSVQLGQFDPEAFGWDNEFGTATVDVPQFRISKYKVTNGEYLDFVRSGAAPTPFFWNERNGKYFYRGMFAEIPLPLDWPAYVTHDEASAFARSEGMSLPTEAQFQRALALAGPQDSGNFDFRRWDPEPVAAHETEGASQLTGNGWEWTSTPFAPFPGFAPFPFYKNYSEPFFDGAHFVLKGASPRTSARLARPSFRNWFRPSYPYIYSTFRLVDSDS